jgi:membrane-associated phospholipid phosphatase
MGVLVIYIVLLTIAFPGITIVMMKVLGFVNSFHLYERKDRIVPLIFTSAFYLWLFVNIYQNPTVPVAFSIFVLGTTLSLFLVFFFNLFVKVSLHTTGVGGLLTAIILIKYYFSYDQFSLSLGSAGVYLISTTLLIFIAIFCAGLVGSSRLILKAHRPVEVLGGYFVGILSQMIAFQFLFES